MTKARDQLRELRAQDDQLAATMDGLIRKREELGKRMEGLERSLTVYREVMGIEDHPQLNVLGEIPTGTIAAMAEAVIVRSGGSARVADIATVLSDQGKLKSGSGRSGYGTVYSILSRNPRFRKASEGVFTLARFDAQPTNGQKPHAEQSPDAAPD